MSMPDKNYQKPEWRARNLDFCLEEFVQGSNYLPCSYFELLGDSGDLSYQGLKKYLRSPQHFIGTDRDVSVIAAYSCGGLGSESCNPTHVPYRVIYHSDAYCLANSLCNEKTLDLPIGIFNFDDTSEIGCSTWATKLMTVMGIATKTVKLRGSCGIILNGTLPTHNHFQALKKHAGMLLTESRKAGWKGLSENDLLGEPDTICPHDGNFGSFDLYQSKGRHYRMATLRLVFTRNFVKACKSKLHLF